MTGPLEHRLRTELSEEADGVELRAGSVTTTVEQILASRRQRRILGIAMATIAAGIIGLSSLALASQGHDPDDQTTTHTLRETEKSRLDALVAANVPVVEQLHADDFQMIPPTGYPLTRETYLDAIANNVIDFRAYEPVSEITVQLHADSAVLQYKSHVEVTAARGMLSHGAWHTCLYEVRDGRWQIVSEQTTAIGKSPPRTWPW